MAKRLGSTRAEVKILYNPYQVAFLEARRQRNPDGTRAFNRLVAIAGRRSGKTAVCGAVSAVEEASVPNTVGWACAPSYPELHDYVIPAVMRLIPDDWIKAWSEEHKELQLINDSKIRFRSLDDPERGRGDGLHWAWIDETCKVQKKAWDFLEPALLEHDGVAFFTSSPRGYDWVYDDFYKPAVQHEPGYFAVRYKTSDNPIIKKEVLERRRATTDPKLFAQEYEAEFIIFEGAIYADYLPHMVLHSDEQVRKYIPEWPNIDPSRPAVVGLDPGADHPFGAVLIVSTERGLVQVAEYRERMGTATSHKAAILRMVGDIRNVTYAIDRSQKQMQIELAQPPNAIYSIQAENAVAPGIHRVQSWMYARQFFVVESTCPKSVEEYSSYHWADTTSKSGESIKERPHKEKDDLMDAVRYGLMTWPHLPKPLKDDPLQARRDSVPHDLRWAWDREERCNKPENNEQFLADHPTGEMFNPYTGSEYDDSFGQEGQQGGFWW